MRCLARSVVLYSPACAARASACRGAAVLRFLAWCSLPMLWLGLVVRQGVRHRQLFEAVESGNSAQVRNLLRGGMDANTVVNTQRMGRQRMIAMLYYWYAHWTNRDENNYRSPILTCAAEKGNPQIVAMLLEAGARVNVKDAQGETPLLAAAGGGRVEAAALLLAHGAHPNAADNGGSTPLMQAARFPKMIRLLLAHGAQVNVRNQSKETALSLVCSEGSLPSARLLVEAGALVNPLRARDEVPLGNAAQKGNLKLVQYLLAQGADVQCPDKDGYTPLMQATNANVWRLLLTHGANIHVVSKDGYTPLMIAAGMEDPRPVQWLLKRGVRSGSG